MSVTQIGRYRVLRELGRGSGAVVYQGRDPDSGKQVAIKVFYARLTSAEDFAERFDRTLRTLRTLEHPGLVPVLDYGIETGEEEDADAVAYYVVTQYMPGGTLAERMDGRPLLLSEVVPIVQRLADGLDAVHAAGFLHGGLNPEQVLFDIRNRAYLADAALRGLLHAQPAEGAVPLPGMPPPAPAGTPAYLSPEQVLGDPADGRADVYALGVVLFEMLTGRQPFQADTTEELLRKHVDAPVPVLSEAALGRLSETSRSVVWLHDVEGYTHEEIGAGLGRSASFSKSQLSRAHARLRQAIERDASARPQETPQCTPVSTN